MHFIMFIMFTVTHLKDDIHCSHFMGIVVKCVYWLL